MRILIKYPTRGRPKQFLKTLREWIEAAEDQGNLAVLVSYDEDDSTMSQSVIDAASVFHPNITFRRGKSKTKIEACNDGASDFEWPWGVVVLVSDDMFVRRKGWDELVRRKMREHFPETDGCLWFHDGTKQRAICTLTVMGRRYYQMHGRYLYHPSYCSFFCDNEFTEFATASGRMVKLDEIIATHEHPSWNGGMKRDKTYERNNPYWAQDEANYHRRKALGFPMDETHSRAH